jgi:type II secretory pathway pseudopilin PulG
MNLYRKPREKNEGKAFTFIEVIISIAITVMVGTSIMFLILIAFKTQKKGYIQLRTVDYAESVKEKITEYLRDGSREASVRCYPFDAVYANHIVFNSEVGAANRALTFNTETKILTYDPDISIEGNEKIIGLGGDNLVTLDSVTFRRAMQTGSQPNSSIILVQLKVSDHGKGTIVRREGPEEIDWQITTRDFAVNLRRN